ncbi:putative zinc-binding peptidase [Blastopirellula sp. JC732]|uniref:Zinc-binding peptidase n=1 Tax=Blastopirellula sediminis TaxID=2894196 RepID=A0A9X1MKX1_9BACT|nr:putative zinc-binding metallopeptidase [Blastopirellula sediminis]MCC9608360.1 putative zinc-binding peptidase [Blastopirellula sediminis]MCC9628863.1 putative zinc-binding peptidase [Blastopirellula sediminis]
MLEIFEAITRRLVESWKSDEPSGRRNVFRCRCERPVYFYNSFCLGCKTPLGYEPEMLQVLAMSPAPKGDAWIVDGQKDDSVLWKRCENFHSPAGCNWLVRADEEETLCRSCRLNNTIPDLDVEENGLWWRKIENAKRRLVAQLLQLGLPVASKVSEDKEKGVMFDFLRSPEKGPRVMTGHASGLITLNIEEADDSIREKTRHQMREPYRTLLGHFRHEIGHYYWDRLVDETPWLEKFRELFGDERESYAGALKRNYEHGPPANWADKHISAYASVHPWEDWAETWAHYLHVVDSLDTALRFGLHGDEVEQAVEPFTVDDLYDPKDPDAKRVILLINSWVQLTTVINELARSMGQQDFYPFVMSRSVLRKMHFIQIVVKEARGGTSLLD